jgi:hypothetical protein
MVKFDMGPNKLAHCKKIKIKVGLGSHPQLINMKKINTPK